MNAVFTIEVQNKYLKDADMQNKMSSISIATVETEKVDDFTVINDATTIPVAGTVRRTITTTLTADFEQRFPTSNDRYYALKHTFMNFFNMQLPGIVTEGLTLV